MISRTLGRGLWAGLAMLGWGLLEASGAAMDGLDVIPGRSFYVDFESSDGSAVIGRGGVKPRLPFVPGPVPGVHGGKGYRLTAKGSQLRYGAVGNANPLQGTAVLWVKPDNFEPSDLRKEVVGNRWNIHAIDLFRIYFEEKKDLWAHLSLNLIRSYDTTGIRLDYNSSGQPQKWGGSPSFPINLASIRKGKWHQVACTWTTDKISVYLNGQYVGSSMMRKGKRMAIRALKNPQPNSSYIRVRGTPKEQSIQRGEWLDVDEFSIFDRVLTLAELKYLYAQSGRKQLLNPQELIACDVQGAYRNGKELVRATVDLTMLKRLLPQRMPAEGVPVAVKVMDQQGQVRTATEFALKEKALATLFLAGLKAGGTYKLVLTWPGTTYETSFDKPDTSWAESTAGLEDVTPAPWTPPVLDGGRVKVWNREYLFEQSPFPTAVRTRQGNLLEQPVRLVIRRDQAALPLKATVTRRQQAKSYVVMEGSLTGDRLAADYRTQVDFDGFVYVRLTFKAPAQVSAMDLQWQVGAAFRRHLLLPAPDFNPERVRAFRYMEQESLGKLPEGVYYNHPNRTVPTMLNFGSEKGGFCWMPVGDDNWVYDEDEKICQADKVTGECRIQVITRPVTIPAGATYEFSFIATPSRPLMRNFRAWRFSGRKGGNDVILRYYGFERNGNLLINGKKLREFTDHERGLQLYAATEFLEDDCEEAKWFSDDWLTYGYSYGMGKSTAIPSCMNTAKTNYLVENTRKSLAMEDIRFVEGYYFDCCELNQCDNELHGCRRVDAFGRAITGTNLLALRGFLMRIVKLLHASGRTVGAHQQQKYCPGIHGLCDYWLAGEELRAIALREGAGVYCDESKITNQHLRTLENFRYLGNIGVCMLVYTDWKTCKNLIPAITRALIEDIKCMGFFGGVGYQRMDAVWKAFAAYKVDEGTVHRFFEQAQVTADAPELKLTYYACPDGRYLLVAGNLTDKTVTGTVSLKGLGKTLTEATDEVSRQTLPVKGGELKLSVPPQDFRLMGIR